MVAQGPPSGPAALRKARETSRRAGGRALRYASDEGKVRDGVLRLMCAQLNTTPWGKRKSSLSNERSSLSTS